MSAQNNIHVPEELLAELRMKAEMEGKSVDGLVEEALRMALEDRSWQKLLEYGRERGRTRGFREDESADIVHNWRKARSWLASLSIPVSISAH
jgi:hypothetical protein